jgi:hypothetical protein
MNKHQELTAEEIILFGLRHSYGRLIKEGFEVLSVRHEPEIDPQIVAKKEEQLYFIVVRTDIYPHRGELPSISRIQQVRDHAQQHKAICKFISIGLTNAQATTEQEKSKLYKKGEFLVDYSGLQELIRLTGNLN